MNALDLSQATGARIDRARENLEHIEAAMAAYEINTPERQAAFLAQIGHESGGLHWLIELWGPTSAQLRYEGRADLGNVHPGDGPWFKGHGPIQITGRTNHAACGRALGLDLLANPTLITTPRYGTASACWFWNSRQLSLLADRDWFLAITRAINGGFNGLADRLRYWNRNRMVLGLAPVDTAGEAEAIKAFQRSHGLDADGVVGPNTLRALGGGR